MDILLNKPSDPAHRAHRSRKALWIFFLLGVVTGIYYNWLVRFLPTYQGAGWLKLGLSLSPWVLFVVCIWLQRRIWRRDELERIIDRDALVFAFYCLLGGVILLDQLQAAGLVGMFAWDNGHLILAMMVSMLAGMGWSKWRFR